MKLSILIAFILYCLGLSFIVDWLIFWYNHEVLVEKNYKAFKQLYIEHFPDFLKPLQTSNSKPATIIMMSFFVISGALFLKEAKLVYKILAVSAFIFAAWSLFTLM